MGGIGAGGNGVMGFMRKHTRQIVTVGVIAVVGITMVALMSANPKGLIKEEAGDRSYTVDSKQKASAKDAQRESLILRIGSTCVMLVSFLFNLVTFARCKKSIELLLFSIVLGVLTLYQIFAIAYFETTN